MRLRTRLLLTSALVAFVALVVAGIVTYSKLRSFLYAQEDRRLELSHRSVEAVLMSGVPYSPRTLGFAAPGLFVETRGVTGERVVSNILRPPGFVTSTPKLPTDINGMTTGSDGELRRFMTVESRGDGPSWRIRTSLLRTGGFLVLALPLDRVERTLGSLRRTEVAVTVGSILAAALLAWWALRRAVRPLKAMEITAAKISAGDLDHRVTGASANTEVGHVAMALNAMLDRIQASFAERDASNARLRRFVSDASHELRTPIAAVSAYAELFGRGADRRPEDLAKVMRGISSESARMKRLVDDLLQLARLDEGPPRDPVPVDLERVCEQAVESSKVIAPEWPVTFRSTAPGVEVLADENAMRQVLDNLLGNVRVHTPKGTSASVTLSAADGCAVVVVADSGPGLAPAAAARVFERFFRADPSRSRASGGAGLGLAIVAGLVRAFGGSVEVAAQSTGAAFVVRIPLVAGAVAPKAAADRHGELESVAGGV